MEYKWNRGFSYNVNPQMVGEEIESLGTDYKLNDVVEKAKDSSSVMHNLFEWDDAVAGPKYREIQAGKIVRNLVIADNRESDNTQRETFQIRAFVSTGNRDNSYTQTVMVVKDKDGYRRLLEQAYRELQAFKKKYSHLKELDEILSLIQD